MNETGTDLTVFAVFGFLAIVGSVSVIMAIWSVIRRYQIRNETILRLLESGQTVDQATLEKLLSPPAAKPPTAARRDPRSPYRGAAFVDFLIGFGTLLVAFGRDAGPSWPLVALAVLPLALAYFVWRGAEKQYREGTLPTLKHERDPRHASQVGGGWLFFIGYATAFSGIVREAGVSYSLIGLGALAILAAVAVWAYGDKEYRQGLDTQSSSDQTGE